MTDRRNIRFYFLFSVICSSILIASGPIGADQHADLDISFAGFEITSGEISGFNAENTFNISGFKREITLAGITIIDSEKINDLVGETIVCQFADGFVAEDSEDRISTAAVQANCQILVEGSYRDFGVYLIRRGKAVPSNE